MSYGPVGLFVKEPQLHKGVRPALKEYWQIQLNKERGLPVTYWRRGYLICRKAIGHRPWGRAGKKQGGQDDSGKTKATAVYGSQIG